MSSKKFERVAQSTSIDTYNTGAVTRSLMTSSNGSNKFNNDKITSTIQKQSTLNTVIKSNGNIKNSDQYSILRRQNKNYRQQLLFSLLDKMYYRRKSYCYQVIKQFYLFPDQTISLDESVNSYDRLFYHDEHIHTICKIYETKQLQAKLWAFINLKTLHIKKKLERFTQHYQLVEKKVRKRVIINSFFAIRQYSLIINKPQLNIHSNPIIQTTNYKQEPKKKTNSPERVRVVQTSRSPITIRRRVESPNTAGVRILYPTTTTATAQSVTPTIITDKTTEIRRQYQNNTYRQVNTNNIDNRSSNIRTEQRSPKLVPTKKVIESYGQYKLPSQSVVYRNQSQCRVYCSNCFQNSRTTHNINSRHTYDFPQNNNNLQNQKLSNQKNTNKELVHTVNGDCTIKIYNNCQFRGQNPYEKSKSSDKSQGKSTQTQREINSSNKLQQEYKRLISQKTIGKKCSCCSEPKYNGYKIGTVFNDGEYCMEQRIQYLKKLETLSEKIDQRRM